MPEVRYEDGNLQRLFAELEPKRRTQALKGGFRKAANKVRKKAVDNLREAIHTDKDLEKGVRAIVFKQKAGFRVTIGTKKAGKNGKGEAGMHTNRRGLKKPVLIWAEEGTKSRTTKSSGGKRSARYRAAHSTGSMPRFGFMAKTRDEVRDTVTEDMHKMVTENVERIAKKYGCK